jgi:general secretion pathway protein I
VNRRGFTLLEILVASVIMGVAVVGLLSNISTSLRNGARLTEYDRAALLAERRMDELLLDSRLPYDTPLEGKFDPALAGMDAGWRARLTRFEMPPRVAPGSSLLERIELEVWWSSGTRRRSLTLEAFRRGVIPAAVQRGVLP